MNQTRQCPPDGFPSGMPFLLSLGIVPYGTALHASEYLRREKETLPWTTVLKRWEYLEAMLGTGVVLEKWKLFIIRILIHHIHSFKWSYTQEDNDKRILLEHQFTVFCTVIEDGDEGEWMLLRTRLEQVSDGVERRNIILALGCTKDRSRLHRYFEEFSASSMRMVPLLFTEVAKRGNFWRLRTAEYILTNWKELKTTYPRHFQGILTSIFKYVSSNEELLEINKLLRRNRWSLLRYSAAFDKIDQAAKKNIQWVTSHYAEVARWLKRDVAEFILDDQVLHGNATLSGLGNDTKNEDETDSLDIGASEVYEARGIPDYRVTDGAIAKENNSGLDSDVAGLGDTLRKHGHSDRAGDFTGTATTMRDFGETFRAKHNTGSHEISVTAANAGMSESHNQSIEGSFSEAVHGHQSVVNNADDSAAIVVPLVTGQSMPKEDDSFEASSLSNTSQSQESNTTKSVTRDADTTFSSPVASRVSTAEIVAKNAKFDAAIFNDSGQDPQLAEYAKDEDYTDTSVTINDFDHILITEHFRDSHNALAEVKRAGSSRNLNGSRDVKNKRMAERAASFFTAAYRDEGAAKNGSPGVDVEMAKATAENFSKKVEFFEISESYRNRSEGSKNKTDIRRGVDITRESSIAPQMNAAEIATKKAESEAFFLKDVEENLGYSKHAQNYTDTTITIRNFDDIFLTRHYIDSRRSYVTAERTGARGNLNGNSDASASVADRPSQGSENRMDADMPRNSSMVSWVNIPAVAAEKVESLVAGPKDREQNRRFSERRDGYTDTAVTIRNFDDRLLSKHYLNSLLDTVVADGIGVRKNHNNQSYASYIAAFSRDKSVAKNGSIRAAAKMPAVTGEKLAKKGGSPKISSQISPSENRKSKDRKDVGRDSDTRSNSSVLSLVSAAGIATDEPRLDSVKPMNEELNTRYMTDEDYTDTTIILENFDDRFLTRHYIDSQGASVVAEGTGLDGTINYSIDESIKGRATSHLSTIHRGDAILENFFAEENHGQNSGFLKMLRSTPFKDQKSKNKMDVERNGDAERSPSVYLVNSPKIKAEVGLNTDSRCLNSSSGSCKGEGQHASSNSLVNGGGKSFKAEERNTKNSNEDGRSATFLPIYSNADGIKVDDNVNERKDDSHFTTSAGFSPSMVLLLRGNTSGIAVEPVSKVANGTVRTTHRSSEESTKKCDEATGSALTIKPRMAPSMIPFTNSYGKVPRAPSSLTERITANTKESGDVRFTPNNEVNSDINVGNTHNNVSHTASATKVANAVTISIIKKITDPKNAPKSFSSTIASSTNVTKPSKSPSARHATEDVEKHSVKIMNTSEITSITNSARNTNAPVTIFPSSDNAGTLPCDSTSTPGQQRSNAGDSGDVHNDSYDDGNEENVDSEYAMREDSARDDHKKLKKLASE
ncbi:hypothetical protein HPB49_015709 [Dermacentor silvarum]|uniref:Uncharacterized protein n=1 Tax=Dermacentor silvarum TaxID=543639 RepID=A0ACB8CLT5_DERSI|nr:hypothetical protein HPB49_015709 [Dermacentor silvarum]